MWNQHEIFLLSIIWQLPKQKRPRNEKMGAWGGHYGTWSNWGFWPGSRHMTWECTAQTTRVYTQIHSHAPNHWKIKSFVSVCELQHHRKECFLPWRRAHMHTHSRILLSSCWCLPPYLWLSAVLSQRGTLSVNVFMSVLWWCRATDSMSDDNDDDYDGQGWAKLAGLMKYILSWGCLPGRAELRAIINSQRCLISEFDLPPPPPIPPSCLISYPPPHDATKLPPLMDFSCVLHFHLPPHVFIHWLI